MTQLINEKDLKSNNFDDIYDKNLDYQAFIDILTPLLPQTQILLYIPAEKKFFGNPDIKLNLNEQHEKFLILSSNKEKFLTENTENHLVITCYARKKNILIICLIPKKIVAVEADFSLFAQLIENTIQFAETTLKNQEIFVEKNQLMRELDTLKQFDLILIEENYQQHFLAQKKEKQYAITLENEIAKQTAELYKALQEAKDLATQAAIAWENTELLNKEHEKQIQYSKEMAQKAIEANNSKREFLTRMSHELRTPMSGVLGMLNLLLGTNLASEQRHFAETANSAAESLLIIINDILDFSQIESESLGVENICFDLYCFLEGFSAIMAPKAAEKDLDFICAPEPDVPSFFIGDIGRIRQILINLTDNAIKFTQTGEVSVLVSVVEQEGQKVKLLFSIKDTSSGISLERNNAIFNIFSQPDSSIIKKYDETELGLAISKQLVEFMGGKIGFKSEDENGSEFWFTVDGLLSERSDNFFYQKEQIWGNFNHEGLQEISLKNHRILLAEDNLTNQQVATGILKKLGYPNDIVSNGLEVIKALEKTPYDIILMDIDMPEMNGLEATKKIRSVNSTVINPCVPIIALTAYAIKGFSEVCAKAGMNDYLTKPLNPQKLKNIGWL